MSTETIEWLNQNVLVGFTEKRGEAWHYRAGSQNGETNHYKGAIPIEDVRRRLFSWKAVTMPTYIQLPNGELSEVPNKKAIVRDDTYEVLGVPSSSYEPHQYEDALLEKVSQVIDDSDLAIGSAGLLKGGAVAWVQIEMPENVKVSDVEFRPHLLATTSFNGSIATTYKRTVTVVVCDNTRAMALREEGQDYRVRHTANSQMILGEARSALQVVFNLGESFTKEIEQMLALKVSDDDYNRFLDVIVPRPVNKSKQAETKVERDRLDYLTLWSSDPRVAPWKNTGFGVIQAVNTYRHHLRPTRGSTMRVERNMMDTLTGVTELSDREAYGKLLTICK
jgi:phage/plasmid-like protein (TIGR03299 family)